MRTGWVSLLLLLWTPALHALDVQIGRSFTITGVTRTEEKVVLPTVRNKYQNIRILSRQTYDFVRTCTQPCVQEVPDLSPTVTEVRPAQSRPGMWIANVSFGDA